MTNRRKRIVIKGNQVSGFADEVSFDGLDLDQVEQRRVSRIVPIRLLLRAAFYLLRALVPDDSRLAAWTRRWRCQWQVVIDGETFGPYTSRDDAIAFEKQEIYRQGTVHRALEESHNESSGVPSDPPATFRDVIKHVASSYLYFFLHTITLGVTFLVAGEAFAKTLHSMGIFLIIFSTMPLVNYPRTIRYRWYPVILIALFPLFFILMISLGYLGVALYSQVQMPGAWWMLPVFVFLMAIHYPLMRLVKLVNPGFSMRDL